MVRARGRRRSRCSLVCRVCLSFKPRAGFLRVQKKTSVCFRRRAGGDGRRARGRGAREVAQAQARALEDGQARAPHGEHLRRTAGPFVGRRCGRGGGPRRDTEGVRQDGDSVRRPAGSLREGERAVQVRPRLQAAQAHHPAVPLRLAAREILLRRRKALADFRRDAVTRRGGGVFGEDPIIRIGGGVARRARKGFIYGRGERFLQELPGLARVDELLGLRLGVVRARAVLQRAPGDVQPAPGDHLLARRRVTRHAAGELQRAEADLRARRLRAREAQQRRQDPGWRPHVRRPPPRDQRASPPRPRLVRAAARDVSELLRVVGAGDADEDLQRDAHGERRRLDVARVQGLRDAAVQRGGAPAQSAALGVALGALAELGRGVVAIRGRRRAQRRVDLAHALHDRGQIGRAGLDELRGRGAHAETRLRRVRAGARHDGSARDRRAGTALSGPGVARCVASVRRFRRGNEEKLLLEQS